MERLRRVPTRWRGSGLVIFTVIALALVLFIQPSHSLSPTIIYSRMDVGELPAELKDYIRKHSSIPIELYTFSSFGLFGWRHSLELIRMQSSRCEDEYCPTFVRYSERSSINSREMVGSYGIFILARPGGDTFIDTPTWEITIPAKGGDISIEFTSVGPAIVPR
jgi:hypothetical protein